MLRLIHMSITKKLFIIMAIMAVLITTELVALSFTIKILSAVRAYVGGEGLWSKAQKNGIHYLIKYAYTHNEKDYQRYLDFMKIPLSDHQARLALSKEPIDYNNARLGFLGGDIHKDDIDGIIWLFYRFNHIYYINKAIKIWAQGDELISELMQQGNKLHQSILIDHATSIDITKQLANIERLNDELTQVENDFSYTLGQASRWLENIIF
ncbi:MAG: hybrid sensor histidine kinase/response regulator, partial [Legionella longbeachae]|nr:hybrid sensor histidine kinase/response regulator [Legionella longbeachae]